MPCFPSYEEHSKKRDSDRRTGSGSKPTHYRRTIAIVPLCVSVLDTDEESGRQLEESVSGIVNTLAAQGEKKLSREIEKLAAKREQLTLRHEELGNRLQAAVEGEYQPLRVGDVSLAPAEAARLIAEAGDEHAWLAGPVDAASPPR